MDYSTLVALRFDNDSKQWQTTFHWLAHIGCLKQDNVSLGCFYINNPCKQTRDMTVTSRLEDV